MLEKIERFQILLLGLVLAIGGVIATGIVSNTISKNVITVTGSYSQNVTSDRGTYEFSLNAREATKGLSYAKLNKQLPEVVKYLKSKGFTDKDITVKPPSGYNVYKMTYNGVSTNEIDAYSANQSVEVASNDVEKIKQLSLDLPALAQKGIDIDSYNPNYYYSKLSDLKVEMLAKATKDAKHRASAMLKATHNRVGKIQSLQMGVFQITPVDSTNVSDYGINDTSSIEKKVTSVANVTFRVK